MVAVPRGDAFSSKFALRFEAGLPIEEVLVDALYDGGLLRNNDQLIAIPAVAEHPEVSVRSPFACGKYD